MNKKSIRFLFLILNIIISSVNYSQNTEVDILKKTALSHMEAGRYGEAIDQLNKYISALPQQADGYNLRAICFEKRQQYQNAVLDYRRAIALEKNSVKKSEYENNLRRVQEIWYAILNKKIEGHLREIAINPENPVNYLEIGKAYRWMEIWDKAEAWYDEYLKRDDNASPDEIIRYTEILAKTGSISKGEKILKKYVERYPDDWRLWSRYGYFTMWLAKYAIAKKAFEKSLSIKPFFKEAQDGLDMVTKQAYITQQSPREFEKEYPIDRYYRILRRNPEDVETRFKLVDELIAAKRYEEAYQQLQIISLTHSEDQRYKDRWTQVLELRENIYQQRLSEAKAKLLINEFDREAVKTAAQYYEYLQYYDSAMVLLNKYFEKYPDETDPQLIYRYARISAWNREFDKAIEITDKLLKEYPNNLDYQLFRAQVSVWINRDIDLAEQYLQNVLKAKPDNLEANIAMGSLKLIQKDYDAAQKYADKAKEIEPANDEVIKLQSNIDWQRMREEEEKLYAILEEGRKKVIAEDCSGALPFYEEYLSKAEPNVLILKEYGDVLFCAKKYEDALKTYNQVLETNYNYDAAMQRAKVYYAMGDSLNAVKEFKELVKQDSTDFEAQMYLGDSFAKLGEHDSARVIYNNLLDNWQLDSTQVGMIKLRKKWLPVTGLAAILETFPNYVGLAPLTQFYNDNLSFKIWSLGSRIDLGVTNFFTLGISFIHSQLKANAESLNQDIISSYNFIGQREFRTLKGHLLFRLSKDLNAGAGFGTTNAKGFLARNERDAFIRFEKKDTISMAFVYQNSDAALILYSPYLIDQRYYSSLYRLEGYYRHSNGLKLSGSFQYITVSDGNEGNDLMLRIGKYFYRDLSAGYEYYYTNYKLKKQNYYSPQNFESHCIWVDHDLENREELKIVLGGKVGIIPRNKFLALEGHTEFFYQPIKYLLISGKVGMGSTSRDESSYRYFSAQLSIYWNVF
ncbi:MAG: tetratricopeptide repeat protein [Melioribacter sp.]|uniref:tetratricopeptide repeat protein n=1 Tax=Rosettibacter primus TaxID=3111523 RepID=UPI00247B9ECB|nr:tetratricopeptide repeat protein [Melioribacter sp.]